MDTCCVCPEFRTLSTSRRIRILRLTLVLLSGSCSLFPAVTVQWLRVASGVQEKSHSGSEAGPPETVLRRWCF